MRRLACYMRNLSETEEHICYIYRGDLASNRGARSAKANNGVHKDRIGTWDRTVEIVKFCGSVEQISEETD